MSRLRCGCVLAFSLLRVPVFGIVAQQPPPAVAPYTLSIAVDEVSLTFHVADGRGASIDDLKQEELRLLDNRRPPRRVVSFKGYHDLPVRAGVLVDTSPSTFESLRRNQQIATLYVQRLMRSPGDSAFVMRFDSQAKVTRDWTSDQGALTSAIHTVAADASFRLGGTTLFDFAYKACHNQFRVVDDVEAGNFILLFSDGIDNASHARIEDDIDMCQSANTSIYVFSPEPKALVAAGEGQKTLRALATATGGRMFFGQSASEVESDLQSMDAAVRSQYRLVYKPDGLRRDGSFHWIILTIPGAEAVVTGRSGYYAPSR